MKRALLISVLLGAVAGPAAAAIDPFYSARMESGFRAFEQGNWEAAERQLRIACFGHLDEPAALVEGLVRLAVAQARLGDEDAFRQTFSRLLELQERFGAYGKAGLPADVRGQFEDLAARLVAAERLRASAGFESIAQAADAQRLAALPPGERRAELTARYEAEPGRPEWILDLARLELAARRPQPALDWLDRLPPAAGGQPPASCLRQQAASEAGSCERMDLTQPFCQEVPATVVEFRLQCLVEAARWPEAAALVAGLDPELRARRRIGRLERRVQKSAAPVPDGIAEDPETAAPTAPAALEPAAAAAPQAAPAAAPALAPPLADPQELARLRRDLDAAESRTELTALLHEVESFADRYPESRQARLLAAEIAYLLADWERAVALFRRAGEPGTGEAQLTFYFAVALFESGEPTAAAKVLRPVASQLERSSFVDGYVERILAPGI